VADLTNRYASFAVRAVDAVLSVAFPDVRNRLNRSEKVYQKQGSFELAFPQDQNVNERTRRSTRKELEGRKVRERGKLRDMVARAKEAVPFREAGCRILVRNHDLEMISIRLTR